jgi:FAD/FMN-containing dehydrogenase
VTNTTPLLDTLRATVGASQVLTTEGGFDLRPFEQDWRRRAQGRALAVVRPGNTAEVATVVKACVAAGVTIVPQGGNTGLAVGSVPNGSGQQIVLSLRRLNTIRHIDAANLTMTVEAGCVLQNVQQAAAAAGFLFPLSLASEGSCTLGGNLATNAGGTQVLRYGNARELCLGLEVVTADGDIWQGLSGLRKDNTGYDLRDLFVGSEGTLGIITAATLKLFPQPAATLTAWAGVPSLEAAVSLLGLAQQHLGPTLTGFEVMAQFALRLVAKHLPQLRVPFLNASPENTPPYSVLLEASDPESLAHAQARFESLMEQAMGQGVVLDAVVAESLAQAQNLWHVRENISLAQSQEGLNIKHDISVPVSQIPAFVATTNELLNRTVPGVRLVTFGHLGDGNLHYNVQAPEGVAAATFLRDWEGPINALVYEQVTQFGGSISAEHGIGSLKVQALEQHKSPVALALMRRIKGARSNQHPEPGPHPATLKVFKMAFCLPPASP